MNKKRILVCGGRDFFDKKFIWDVLDNVAMYYDLMTIPDVFGNVLPLGVFVIVGDAKGVDSLALDWAIINHCSFIRFKANWKKYGKKAGVLRNQEMIDCGKPELVVAFPGGTGTKDMIKRAKKYKIEIIKV